MKKQWLLAISWLLLSGLAFSQPKPKAPAKKTVSGLEKILAGTALPYQMKNDSLAIIPYTGEHLEDYNVVVQTISDLYIVYVDLSETLPGKLSESQYKYLLQRNDYFDLIKIGLAENGTFYLRADVFKTSATSIILKRIISQVANVTNIIGGDLK